MAERPLFDPSRIRVPESERSGDHLRRAMLTPRQVNELIRGAINRYLPPTLHVLGEIGDISRAGSGHVYFTLKDDASELRCVMWRSAAGKLRFEPETGLEVIATGGIEVYAPRGAVQLVVRSLEPRGVGALEIAFRQLRQKLEAEGLFDPRRKKLLPRLPQRIAVVTSESGAAIRDILQTLARRFPIAQVLLFPVRVQGEGAAAEIAAAIELMNRRAAELGGIDVAIVGRGGGSLEDLWAFNEEIVARAIAASHIPIISAVGHETDTSISDLVADQRAATPTAAAELVAPHINDLRDFVAGAAATASRTIRHAVDSLRHALTELLARPVLARPQIWLFEAGQRIDELVALLRDDMHERISTSRAQLVRAEAAIARFGAGAGLARAGGRLEARIHRLEQAFGGVIARAERRLAAAAARCHRAGPQQRLGRGAERLEQLAARAGGAARGILRARQARLAARLETLEACNPRRVLHRGYSITRDARTRSVIRALEQVRDGQRLVTEVSDGEFRSTADDPRQPGLFD